MNVYKEYIKLLIMKICHIFPVRKNKIVISSFFSKQYSDNPKYISEELEKYPQFEIVWLMQTPKALTDKVRVVKAGTVRAIYELATAKVWVDNSRKYSWVRKRKSQFYVQTWHGGVCLKAVEADAEDTLPKEYIKGAKHDSKMADVFISECEWRTQNYRNAFWYTGEILKIGLPRSDIFYRSKEEFETKVHEHYGLKKQIKFILYAPTFRGDKNLKYYDIDSERILATVRDRFGGDWRIIIRLHPNLSELRKNLEHDDKVLDGNAYSDMNELLIASEILITDYSGCMFDAYRLNKKVLIYANDLKAYQEKERKLYFNIRELPAPLAESNEQLCLNINSFDETEYVTKCEKLLKNIGYYGNGHATEQIVNRIKKEMGYL